MRVTLTRTGGVAGIRLHCSVDSETLSPRDAARLRRLLASADLPSSCAKRRGNPVPDSFQYTVATEEGGEATTYRFGDDVPENVQALLDWLRKKAIR